MVVDCGVEAAIGGRLEPREKKTDFDTANCVSRFQSFGFGRIRCLHLSSLCFLGLSVSSSLCESAFGF